MILSQACSTKQALKTTSTATGQTASTNTNLFAYPIKPEPSGPNTPPGLWIHTLRSVARTPYLYLRTMTY